MLCKCFYKQCNYSNLRHLSTSEKTGYILGAYAKGNEIILTETSTKFNENCSGKIIELLNYGGKLKTGSSRLLFGLSDAFPIVSVVGLGKKNDAGEANEAKDEVKENIRSAIAAGCRALKELEVDRVIVDDCGDETPAAEGAVLSLFSYQEFKSEKKKIPLVQGYKETDGWKEGLILAQGQNIARRLMEMPSNILTPSNFAQESINYLEKLEVDVRVRTQEWAKERNMNAFLAVSKGSDEPPVFLELTYNGDKSSNDTKLAVVGKGVTFDTGGISIKPSSDMDKMRADMGGAACTVGSIYAAAQLKLPINIKGFIPLCENMPSGRAVKPGDVIVASNGKSVQVDNTDAEGRLILADALHYASQFKPRVIVDMATLTGAMAVALGGSAAGVFTKSCENFEILQKASYETGDRVWRMPLWNVFTKQVKDHGNADVNNVGKHSRMAGACTAAAFLKEFVSCDHWMHLDIAGVMENKDEVSYLSAGMSGRPTRTVVKYAQMLASQ